MKKLLLILICILPTILFAQKIDVDGDDIKVDGELYCTIKSTGTMAEPSYVVSNSEGNELIAFDNSQEKNTNGTGMLNVTFFSMKDKEALMPMTIGIRKYIAKKLVNYKMIENGELNETGVERFCKEFKARANSQSNNNNNENEDKEEDWFIKRNTDAPIFISGKEIKQDFKTIGKYSSSNQTVNGKILKTIKIYNHNGSKIVEASVENFSSNVELAFKNKKSSMDVDSNLDEFSLVKEIVKELISRGKL